MHDSNLTEERLYARLTALRREERSALLDRETADDRAMRARLEKRLQAYDRLPGNDEVTASNPVKVAESVVPEPADGTIGRYKLRQKLGEGGCGVVYLAEQAEPVRRRVALKVIKLGMDTKVVIARFEAERQALALMDHPNIAKVFDAGTTDVGRPYFVMELVRGIRLTDYCDQQGVTTRGRIELFIQVCGAIQHAHQKGIIHRDLKPSNILVAVQDGLPMPKVIDFGIAKSIHGRLADATVFTGFEQFIGTPAYMSPEQAELSGADIDTRTDIYSLGVVLYELLTGRLPLDPKTLTESGLDEIRRLIREVDPPRPSTRLGTMTEVDFTNVAKRRGAAPSLLSAEVRGDLDWIVMKAIEKQRNRRYESAAALAADLTRHLQDEPVLARPPSAVYRTQKFVRRHKVAAAAAAAVVLALVAGTVVSTWQAVRARRAERLAQREREEARRSQDRAEDLLAFMLGDLRKQLEKVGRLDVLEAVGEKAMAYFLSLNPRELTDTTLARQAKALTQLGEIRIKQARYGDAERAFAAAYGRTSSMVARHPGDGEILFARAQAEYWTGFVHWKRGTIPAAKDWLTRYRDSAVALLEIDGNRMDWLGEVAYGHHNLAVLEFEGYKLESALRGFQEEEKILSQMVSVSPSDLDLQSRFAELQSWFGIIADRSGDLAEAGARYADQIARLKSIVRSDPKTARWQAKLAESLGFHAAVLACTGKRAESLALRNEAKTLLDALVTRDPQNQAWQSVALNFRIKEARLLHAEGNTVAAMQLVDEGKGKLETMWTAEPADRGVTERLAAACRLQAQLRYALGRADAATSANRASQLLTSLIADGRANIEVVSAAAQTDLIVGEISARESPDHARARWQEALRRLEPYLATSRDWRVLDPAARALAFLGRADESRIVIERLKRFGYDPIEHWPAPRTSTN